MKILSELKKLEAFIFVYVYIFFSFTGATILDIIPHLGTYKTA